MRRLNKFGKLAILAGVMAGICVIASFVFTCIEEADEFTSLYFTGGSLLFSILMRTFIVNSHKLNKRNMNRLYGVPASFSVSDLISDEERDKYIKSGKTTKLKDEFMFNRILYKNPKKKSYKSITVPARDIPSVCIGVGMKEFNSSLKRRQDCR